MADDKPKGAAQGGIQVDTDLVRTLAEMLAANDLTEIEVEDGGRKIRVKREAAVQQTAHHAAASSFAPVAAAESLLAPVAAAPSLPSQNAVKSPMVGTAFLRAEPGGKPFVSPGDTVKAGDTLLIVEAMKVMNPILAPTAGTVRQILVADAQPVEYDQPLVVVD
jgi:acetyl-CoA carboxylase biotin carboxyl carrier protein